MKVTLISPYHGGSHKAWAEGYQQRSSHQVQILSLPARYWKWRMHGGAVTLARKYLQKGTPSDLILATGMLDLTSFLAITRRTTSPIPAILYLHENQLTYPLPEDPADGPMRRQKGERDQHYSFINFVSMLAADRVWFNSEFHRESFFNALPAFLKGFPEHNELNSIPRLKQKSRVLPVGIDFERLHPPPAQATGQDLPPLILWNQRWEYDKNPESFFRVLYEVADHGIPFRLAICGQNFRRRPVEFQTARERLGERVVHAGYAPEGLYRSLLWESLLTVSTAHHEFFGISILEAVHCRTLPLLPNRLSYPELIPKEFHPICLYGNRAHLVDRLEWGLTHPGEAANLASGLSGCTRKYDWRTLAPEYDRKLAHVAEALHGR